MRKKTTRAEALGKRSKIDSLIGGTADFIFEGKAVRDMREPCVYIWVRDEEVLYVGKGSSGIQRPLSSSHHRLRNDAIRDTDRLLIYRCGKGMEEIVEQALIEELRPTLNRTPNLSGIKSSRTGRGAIGIRKMTVAEIVANNQKFSHENAELQRLVARARILEDAEDRATLARPIIRGEYGPVFVAEDYLDEDLCGKIGYYDDDEVPDHSYADFKEHSENCVVCAEADIDFYDLRCKDGRILLSRQAVIYFEPGDFESGNYVFIEHEFLGHVPGRLMPEWLREP